MSNQKMRRNPEEVFDDSVKIACLVPPILVKHKLWSHPFIWDKIPFAERQKILRSICNITRDKVKQYLGDYFECYVHGKVDAEIEEMDRSKCQKEKNSLIVKNDSSYEIKMILNGFLEIFKMYQTMITHAVTFSKVEKFDKIINSIIETEIACIHDNRNEVEVSDCKDHLYNPDHVSKAMVGEGSTFYADNKEKKISEVVLLTFILVRAQSESTDHARSHKKRKVSIFSEFEFFILEIPKSASEAINIKDFNTFTVSTWLFSWIRLVVE